MRKTELLIPAGSLDVLKTAVIYGADAVYIGGEAFGLRAKAHNFSSEEMKEESKFMLQPIYWPIMMTCRGWRLILKSWAPSGPMH